jgi:hypothetical protein
MQQEEEKPKVASNVAPFLLDKTPIGNYEVSNETFEQTQKPKLDLGFFETAQKLFPANPIYRKFMQVRDEALAISEYLENPNEKFNMWQEQYMSQLDPKYWPEASFAKTEGQFFRKVAEINQRMEERQTLEENSGWTNLAAGIANGIVNPLNYVAMGTGLTNPTLMPFLRNLATKSIPVAMTGAAIDEFDLHYNHQMRTFQEAMFNTAFTGVLVGALGGVGQGYRSLKMQTYKQMIKDQVKGADIKFRVNDKGEYAGFAVTEHPKSGGSAAVQDPVTRYIDLENESLYGWGKDGKIRPANLPIWLGAKVFQNPILRGLTSKSAATRGFINDALEHNLDLTMTEKGFKAPPQSIQSAIQDRMTSNHKFNVRSLEGYYKYLGVDPDKSFIGKAMQARVKRAAEGGEQIYTYSQYLKELNIATVSGGVHENASIAGTSKELIRDLMDPIYADAVELELLPPDLTPAMAAQHVMRVHDREFIAAHRPKVLSFLINEFTETNDKLIKLQEPIRLSEQRISALENEIRTTKSADKKLLQAELKKAKQALKAEQDILNKKIKTNSHPEELTADMLIGAGKDRRLRPIADMDSISESANHTIEKLLRLTEEQMNEDIVGFLRSGNAGPDPLKRRTLMIEDKKMLEFGMLNGDIRVAFGAYNTRMSRLIEMEKYLKTQGYDGKGGRLEFLTNGIDNDYRKIRQEAAIRHAERIEGKSGKALEKLEKKYAKENAALAKSQARDVETVSTVYKRLMGQTGVQYGSFLKLANAAKQWLYATELGAMTLLQLQDIAAPIFRMGWGRFLNHGTLPFLKNIAKLDFKANKRLRENAQDLGLGIDSALAFHNIGFSFERDSFVPLNFAERASEKMANTMGIANLSNFVGDVMNHMSATASASSIIRDLEHAIAGTLDDKWVKRLLNLRVDPKSEVAHELIRQAKKHGTWKSGAVDPNLTLWDISTPLQRQALQLFRTAIRKETRSVMFSGSNIASFPVGGEPNGMLGAFIMYMGWGLNAVTNFTIPMFQKLDMNRVTSAMTMILIASTVEPIRAWASGREVTEEMLEPGMLFKEGVLNSGLLGTFGDAFNKLNEMGDVFPGMRVDRFKNTRGIVSFGPERLVADLVSLMGMVANNEYNKKDLKRLIKNLGPVANIIYMRKLFNDWLDSMDIPETRQKAERLKEWR